MTNQNQFLKQGYVDFKNKNYQKSCDLALKILESGPNIDALMLTGMSLFQIKNFSKAEYYLAKAYQLILNNHVLHLYYLETLLETNGIEIGLKIAKDIKNKSQEVKLLEILLFEKNGQYTKAISQAETLDESVQKKEILAWNLERINDLNKAEKFAKQGFKLNQEGYKCNVVLSKIYLRKNKPKKAKKSLKNIKLRGLSPANLSIYFNLKGQILEKLKCYKKAFKNHTKSNEVLKQSNAYKLLKGNSYYTFDKIATIKNYFYNKPQFENLLESKTPVVFMLGFPRSGTTLLENILNSHSLIASIEEKPTIDSILHQFLQTPDSIEKLSNLSDDEIKELQSGYLHSRKLYCSKEKPVIIDKMPLNIIHIGLLYRIFPNAKFIVSTREIRDVALSCYFQNFAINDAMANFLDWDTTNKYLIEIMQLGLSIINNYPINHYLVSYEKLVEDTFGEVKSIINFLGLEWQENIKDYREKIVGKNINTPSYAKISEKITQSRKQRWKNYRDQFND